MRSIILAYTLIGVVPLIAQFPFPTDNARWTQSITYYSTGGFPPQTYGTEYESYFVDGSDTLIDGRVYSKVFAYDQSYFVAIRDTAGKVMVVPGGSSTEEVLYDFTLPIGVDTLVEYWAYGSTSTMLRNLGPVGPDGRMVVTAQWGGFDLFTSWIEGIGCGTGLFFPPYIGVSGMSSMLVCMSHYDSILFPYAMPGICELTNSIEPAAVSELRIHPDPVTDLLQVDLALQNARGNFKVYAIDGRVMIAGHLDGSDRLVIPVEQLLEGTYLLSIDGCRPRSFMKMK